jgi:hypothetical protein
MADDEDDDGFLGREHPSFPPTNHPSICNLTLTN